VVIQLAENRLGDRVGDIDEFKRQIRALIEKLLEQELSIIAVSHIAKDDDLTRFCGESGTAIRLADHRRDLKNIRQFFGVYKNARVVIAMRGHAQICAYGLGIPFLSIATQEKNKGFLKEIHYSLDASWEPPMVLPTDDMLVAPGLLDRLMRGRGGSFAPEYYRRKARQYHDELWERIRNV